MSSSDKYKLTSTPVLPGRCVGCSKSATGKEQFLDTTCSVDYYGAIYFCLNCAKEIGRALGMDFVEKVQEENSLLKAELDFNKQKVELADGIMDSLRDIFVGYGIAADPAPDATEEPPEADEPSSESVTVPSKGPSRTVSKF